MRTHLVYMKLLEKGGFCLPDCGQNDARRLSIFTQPDWSVSATGVSAHNIRDTHTTRTQFAIAADASQRLVVQWRVRSMHAFVSRVQGAVGKDERSQATQRLFLATIFLKNVIPTVVASCSNQGFDSHCQLITKQ